MRKAAFFVIVFLFTAIAVGIPNGRPVSTEPPKVRDGLRPIVQIQVPGASPGSASNCTATFISSNPLIALTAHHCVKDGNRDREIFYVSDGIRLPAEHGKVFTKTNKPYSMDGQPEKDDLAIVVFNDRFVRPVFPALPLASCPAVKTGTGITLVGFGANDTTQVFQNRIAPGAGVKRVGTNQVKEVGSNGLVTFDGLRRAPGRSNGDGNRASLGPGDSGGPMLVGPATQPAVAGVASYIDELKPGDDRNLQLNAMVDICEQGNRDWIAKTLAHIRKQGARGLFPATEMGSRPEAPGH